MEPLQTSFKLWSSYVQRNYVRTFKLFKKLPIWCQLALHRRLNKIEW